MLLPGGQPLCQLSLLEPMYWLLFSDGILVHLCQQINMFSISMCKLFICFRMGFTLSPFSLWVDNCFTSLFTSIIFWYFGVGTFFEIFTGYLTSRSKYFQQVAFVLVGLFSILSLVFYVNYSSLIYGTPWTKTEL